MAFAEIDEKLLVRAYQAGDDRAFDTIVRTQYNALYAHAVRRLSDHESAEDAVQDTLIRAYRALPNLDGDLALRAWLHRILTNVCHDEGNRRRRRQGLVEKIGALPEETVEDIADEAALFDTVRVMQEALEDLPESYREALVLRYVDGLSFREVAEATGVTEENARARVHRGKLALHKVMSRIAVMVAFIIPGLKRTQHAATTPGAEQAAVSTSSSGVTEHAVSLTTQLTTHVVNAAPTVSRFAEMSASLPGGKSTLAAAAVTAVAAVTVPVAYTVNEVRKPERPPAAVAAPAQDDEGRFDAATTVPTTGGSTSTTSSPRPSTSTTSSTTIPDSLARPFEVGAGVTVTTVPRKQETSPSSTTSTTSTTVPPEADGPVLAGQLSGSVEATGQTPQFDLDGELMISTAGGTYTGELSGRLYAYEDGTASSDGLVLTVDETVLELRFRGRVVRTEEGGRVIHSVTGVYSLPGASVLGLAERGDLFAAFRDLESGTASFSVELKGRAS